MRKSKTLSVAKQIVDAINSSAKPSQPWCEGLIAEGDAAIEIQGLGPMRLPMRPADVRKLVDVASQAPSGKGTETIIDTRRSGQDGRTHWG